MNLSCSHLVTALFLSDQRQVALHSEVMLRAGALAPRSFWVWFNNPLASAGGFSLLLEIFVNLQYILFWNKWNRLYLYASMILKYDFTLSEWLVNTVQDFISWKKVCILHQSSALQWLTPQSCWDHFIATQPGDVWLLQQEPSASLSSVTLLRHGSVPAGNKCYGWGHPCQVCWWPSQPSQFLLLYDKWPSVCSSPLLQTDNSCSIILRLLLRREENLNLCELSTGCNGHNCDGGVPATETGAKHVYHKNKQLWGPGFHTFICVTEMPVTVFSTLELKLVATGTWWGARV